VLQSDGASEAAKRGARVTLITTLETLLRALHPVAPFITEEIWQRVRAPAGATGETIMRAPFPVAADLPEDAAALGEMQWVQGFILGVRQIRGEMDIAPGRRIDAVLQHASPQDLSYLGRNRALLVRLAGLGSLDVLGDGASGPVSAVALLGTLEILVPMAGLIDPTAEMERLARRQRKAEQDTAKLSAKLGDAKFAANAPPEIIAKDTQRLAELRLELGQLAAQVERVRKLVGP